MIRPAEFPGRKDLHYSFQENGDWIEVRLRVPGATEVFPAIADLLTANLWLVARHRSSGTRNTISVMVDSLSRSR